MKNNKFTAIVLTALISAQNLVSIFANETHDGNVTVQGDIMLTEVGGETTKSPEGTQNSEITVTADLRIMATTDLHANIMDYDYYKDIEDPNMGLSRVAGLIDLAKKEVDKSGDTTDKIDNAILVDNGDTIQGNPLANVYAMGDKKVQPGQKYPVYEALDVLGYDATTAGNHEFNYGLDFIKQITDKSVMETSFINANVYDMEGNPIFEQYKVIEETVIDNNGDERVVKIGLTGFVPPQILNWDKQHLDGKVTVKDIKTSAEEMTKVLKEKEGVDIVVALSHSGTGKDDVHVEGSENASFQLTKVEGIDVVVAGHSHSTEATTMNGVQVVQPANWGKELGIVDLKLNYVNDTWVVDDTQSTVERRSVKELTPENNKLITSNQIIKEAHAETVKFVNTPVGKSTKGLDTYLSLVQDNPAVELIANAQTWYLEEKIKEGQTELQEYKDLPILSAAAPFKAGGRGFMEADSFVDIASGDLKIKDLSNLYIYDNTVSVLKLTGAQVKEWLEMSAGMFNTVDLNSKEEQNLFNNDYRTYNFDTIEGITYEIDVTKPNKYDPDGNVVNENSERISNVKFNGKDLDLNQEFLVATNNYRASGQFPGVKDGELVYASTDENRVAIMDYIKSVGEINPSADNNWKFKTVDTTANVVFPSNEKAKNHMGSNISVAGNLENGMVKYKYDLSENTTKTDFDTHWAKESILNAMNKGIVDNSTTFNPNKSITRAEFAKIVYNVFNVEKSTESSNFSDVSNTSWYYEAVNALTQNGIIDGYDDNTFRPNESITRQEASKIVANAHIKFKTDSEVLAKFTSENKDGSYGEFNGTSVEGDSIDSKTLFIDDSKIATWADGAVNALTKAGVIKGYEDNTFRADGKISKAEALVMITGDNRK